MLDASSQMQNVDAVTKNVRILCQDMQQLLNSGNGSDVVMVVGNSSKHFQAHKLILSARSPAFAAMFNHDTKENREGKVDIPDVQEDVFEEFLRFIYTGTVEGLDQFAAELLIASDKVRYCF